MELENNTNKVENYFFPSDEDMPEIDEDIITRIDSEISTNNINPLEDPQATIPETKINIQIEKQIIENTPYEDLEKEYKTAERILIEILEYYSSIFPERFSNALLIYKEEINKISEWDQENNIDEKIKFTNDLIKHYIEQANQYLTIEAKQIIDNTLFKQKIKQTASIVNKSDFKVIEIEDFDIF